MHGEVVGGHVLLAGVDVAVWAGSVFDSSSGVNVY